LYNELFNASHVSLVFEKHNSSNTLIFHPFPVKYTKNAPFLIKARSHNLPWLTISHWSTEVWKDQFQFTFSASKNFVRRGS